MLRRVSSFLMVRVGKAFSAIAIRVVPRLLRVGAIGVLWRLCNYSSLAGTYCIHSTVVLVALMLVSQALCDQSFAGCADHEVFMLLVWTTALRIGARISS